MADPKTVADKTEDKPTVTVAAKLSGDLGEKLEAYRWGARKSKSEVVVAALESFLADK